MNRYILIRRLYGPAFLLLVGVDALLDQAHILTWSQSWPFFLILLGVLKLAERAALASGGYAQAAAAAQPNPWSQPQPVHPGPIVTPVPQAEPVSSSSVIPSIPIEIIKKNDDPNQEGGK